MIYAKCLNNSQICHNEDEFNKRIQDGETVYLKNHTTKSQYTLSAVPLNYIFCVLKYGTIAGILQDYKNDCPYPKTSSYLNYQIDSQSQTIVKFLDLNTYDGLEYVFKTVGDASLIIDSLYINTMLDEQAQKWFHNFKNNQF